jgi:hypothetical protein
MPCLDHPAAYSDGKHANRNARVCARGDIKWSLNDGQIPNSRGVRVALGTGYDRVEGNRRASRNGRVSDLSPEIPHVTIRDFFIAVQRADRSGGTRQRGRRVSEGQRTERHRLAVRGGDEGRHVRGGGATSQHPLAHMLPRTQRPLRLTRTAHRRFAVQHHHQCRVRTPCDTFAQRSYGSLSSEGSVLQGLRE